MLAAEKNRLVRLLSDAGIRLTAVVSDPHGVAARALIDCLLEGGTPEQALRRTPEGPPGGVAGLPPGEAQ
jgi:transposase